MISHPRRKGGKTVLRSRKSKRQPHPIFRAATPSRCLAWRAGAAYEIVTIRRNHYSARIDGPDFVSISRQFRRLQDAKLWIEAHAAAGGDGPIAGQPSPSPGSGEK